MIKFFRKIRQKLLSENRLGKYLIYAFGEIILVVIGILIALQLNNWNEKRKNKEEFKAILNQIYTVIDQEAEEAVLEISQITQQIDIIDQIQQYPDSINRKLLPHLLFYLDLWPRYKQSEITHLLTYIEPDPQNEAQINLTKSLFTYGKVVRQDNREKTNELTTALMRSNIPQPSLYFGYSTLNDFQNMDMSFYEDSTIKKVEVLIKDQTFLNKLKSLKSRKETYLIFSNQFINFGNVNKNIIREYDPKVQLLYSNIGIVGDATEFNDWVNDVKLTLTNASESIWEGDVVLNEGTIKFREGGNWNFNWGGNSFPTGNALWFGNNIPVKAGRYHVIINLSKKTYEFIKQND